jgi:hypothetical protein
MYSTFSSWKCAGMRTMNGWFAAAVYRHKLNEQL